MKHDLDLITLWARDWRMSFNADPRKQAVELVFSRKNVKVDHPVILFNDVAVSTLDQHKHLYIRQINNYPISFVLFSPLQI